MPLCDQLEQMMRSLSELQQSLTQLARSLQVVDSANKKGADTEGVDFKADIEPIGERSAALLPQFLGILEALESADTAPQAEQQIRAYKTEAHRRLRLMKTEAMRLRTARSTATIEKSRVQLADHLSALQQFAAAIANAVRQPDGSQ